MIQVTFVRPDGEEQQVEAVAGTSVMQAALASGIAGIIGECGGAAMCATCHVYVDDAFTGRLPPIGALENEMLECTASERTTRSRLGCQIVLSDDLSGLRLHLPSTQFPA